MPEKDAKAAENGDGETDPKAPLANEEEEDIGDPVPNHIQATQGLCGFFGCILLAMGLTSSNWVVAVEGNYWQGLFVYCAAEVNETAESLETSIEDSYEPGCYGIDLESQGYTMLVALFVSIALGTNLFGLILSVLGSWVRDIDSKRKSYKLSLVFMIISVITCLFSLIIYAACFGEVIEEEPLGPFKDPEDEWEVGWSYELVVLSLIVQVISTLCVGYSLLLLPIIEEVEEEAAEEK